MRKKKEKKNNNNFGAGRIGLLPNYIVKKKNCIERLSLYYSMKCIASRVSIEIFIAIQFLYCREYGLRGGNCIAT